MTRQQQLQKWIKNSLTLLLAGVYMLAGLSNFITSYTSQQQLTNALCSIEAEQNACHLSVVHHDLLNGCHHPIHITKTVSNTNLFPTVLYSHVATTTKAFIGVLVKNTPLIPALEEQLISNPICTTLSLRGPPLFS